MKRHLLFLCIPVTLAVSACSREEGSEQPGRTQSVNVTEDSAISPPPIPKTESTAKDALGVPTAAAIEEAPGIAIGAAPNVAFEYRYAFKLPDAKISAIQNEHADACEALGNARCQITDMQFNKIDDKRVEAALAFKLDPAIARKFGRDAIASVEKAEGILADGNVTGTNVGGQIEDSQGRSAMLESQLDRLQKRLANKKLSASERAALSERVEELQKELGNEQGERTTGEAKLAMTPVQFTYVGDDGVPGFGKENPFANAFGIAASSFAVMFSFVLMALGFAGPWILLAALIVLFLRSRFANGVKSWWSQNKQVTNTSEDS
jgi:hypothetical protein